MARLVRQGLVNTDQRVAQGKPVTPTFLFALLLYGPFAEIIEKQPQEKWHDIGTIVDAVDRAARGAQGRISIPKRFSLGVREMFAAQPRLEQPRGRRALRMLEQPRFRAGFDLLLLRADMGLASREHRRLVDDACRKFRRPIAIAWRMRSAPQRPAGEGGGCDAAARAVVAGVGADAHPRPHERSGRRAGRSCRSAALAAGLRRRGQQSRRTRARRWQRALEALGRLRGCTPGGQLAAVPHAAAGRGGAAGRS